jgi:hypothetical protein
MEERVKGHSPASEMRILLQDSRAKKTESADNGIPGEGITKKIPGAGI